jgi:GAF domain-containing protein
MHELQPLPPDDKPAAYVTLAQQLRALLAGEADLVACTANAAALLYWSLPDLNWAGFYLLDEASGELLVGPFQGKPACVRIPIGRGVCGTAAEKRETVVVTDVHAFPGHIACDARAKSEIVIPLIHGDCVIAVLDIDSAELSQFDESDIAPLTKILELLNPYL